MNKVFYRTSKIQTTGDLIFEGDLSSCESYTHTQITQHVEKFLTNPTYANHFATQCFKVPSHEVTYAMLNSQELKDFTYAYFTEYYAITE